MFDGEYVRASTLPLSYIPLYLGVKLPEILLLAFIGSVPMAAWAFVRALRDGNRRLVFGFLTLCLGIFFPVVFSMAARSVLYDGVRHFLFILPPMAVLVGWQVADLARRMVHRRPRLAVPLIAVGVVAFGVVGWRMVSLHPYEYVYYNSLIGGPAGAAGRFETDYWATSYREAVDKMIYYVDTHAQQRRDGRRAKPYGVLVCGPTLSATPYLLDEFQPVNDLRYADFFISYTRWKCDQRVDAPIVATVERAGVPLAYVKDLRTGFSVRKVDLGEGK